MSRSARLVVRVVLVPGGRGAADARRRIADVLLCAASTGVGPPDTIAPVVPANAPSTPTVEKAA